MGDFLSSFGDVRFVAWLVVTLFVYGLCYWRYQKHVQVKVNEITAQVIAEHRDNPGTDADVETQRRIKESVFFAVIKYSIIVAVFTVVTTYLFFFGFRLPVSSSPEHWGQMGDFFGGMLNPILAFASFIALLYTIRIQSEELRLTREEFAKSVKEQAGIASSQRDNVRVQTEIADAYKAMLENQKTMNSVGFCTNLLHEKIKLINDIIFTQENVKGEQAATLYILFVKAQENVQVGDSAKPFKEFASVVAEFHSFLRQRYHSDFRNGAGRLARELSVADYWLEQLVEMGPPDGVFNLLHAELSMPAALCEMVCSCYGIKAPSFKAIMTDFYLRANNIKK